MYYMEVMILAVKKNNLFFSNSPQIVVVDNFVCSEKKNSF